MVIDARECRVCGGPMTLVGPGQLEQCGVGLSVPADVWICWSDHCGGTTRETVPRLAPAGAGASGGGSGA